MEVCKSYDVLIAVPESYEESDDLTIVFKNKDMSVDIKMNRRIHNNPLAFLIKMDIILRDSPLISLDYFGYNNPKIITSKN